MYNQYVAGDLIYSRIYEHDPPPQNAAAPLAQTAETSDDASTQGAIAATVPREEQHAGSTGLLSTLGLGGEGLPLLLLLLLLLQKGSQNRSPLLLGLLMLGLGKRGGSAPNGGI